MGFSAKLGVAALAAACLLAAAAQAEVVITLKNGVKISVPVNSEDIATIELDGKPAETKPAAPAPAAKPAPAPAPEKKPEPAPPPVAETPKQPQPPAQATPPEAKAAAAEVMKSAAPKGLPSASNFRSDAFAPQPPKAGDPSRVVRIGPGRDYERPSEYAPEAREGDVVEIEAGDYVDDFVVWKTGYLTLKGVGGRPHFRADSSPNNGKAIWVAAGDFITVENIEFSGARVGDGNGGGIRAEGGHLTVRNSYFHHNQTGILSTNREDAEIEIENSEFSNLVDGSGRAHAIYIGKIKRLSVTNSYFHHNDIGHHVKTRAAENTILYNKITDEDGGSSYLIDMSNCGRSYVVGNVLHQSRRTDNSTAVSYGAEGCAGRPKGLYMVNNSFINDRHSGIFVKNYSPTPAVMTNNIAYGGGQFVSGAATEAGNVVDERVRFRDRDALDLHLTEGSDAIDAGVDPGMAGTFKLTPQFEYGYPGALTPRKTHGKIDAGAFEYQGGN